MANNINYYLHIQRNIGAVQGTDTISFYFAVCEVQETESGKRYPQGYICNLPKSHDDLIKDGHSTKSKTKSPTQSFISVFADVDRVKFALDLLKEAIINPKYAEDKEIKSAIEARISLINRQILETKQKRRWQY